MPSRVKHLMHSLLLPVQMGDRVVDDLVLTGVDLIADKPQIVYTFAPHGLRIAIEPRSSQGHFAQTPSFNLLHQSGGEPLTRSEGELLKRVTQLVRANDPGAVVWKTRPTLYLVPGALGDPMDLSVRAVEALRSVSTILVEPGKESITGEILRAHGLAADDKRILALPADAAGVVSLLDDLLVADEDFALFGADEGLPGFNDPGKDLLAAAAALGDRLDVRTIAGPSALAMALLRLPFNIDRFVFLGVLSIDPVGAVESVVRKGEDKAIILFLVSDLDAIVVRLAGLCSSTGRDLFLACNLTCADEFLFHLRPGDDRQTLPTLGTTTRTVVVLGPGPTPKGIDGA